MSACPVCGTGMKPLFVGEYCPRDCDRPRDTVTAPSVLYFITPTQVYHTASFVELQIGKYGGMTVIMAGGARITYPLDVPTGTYRFDAGNVKVDAKTDTATWPWVRVGDEDGG